MSRGRDDLYFRGGHDPLLVLAFTKVVNEKKAILYQILRALLDDSAQQAIRDSIKTYQTLYDYKKYYHQFTCQLNELIKDHKNKYKSAFDSKDFDVEQSRIVNTFLMDHSGINDFILDHLNVKKNPNLHYLINGYYDFLKSEEKKAKQESKVNLRMASTPGALESVVTEVRNDFKTLKFSQRETLWFMLGTPFNETEREIAEAWLNNGGKKFQKLRDTINEKITELMVRIPQQVYESVMVPFQDVNKSVQSYKHSEEKVYEFFATHPEFFRYICQLLKDESFMEMLDAYDMVLAERNELVTQYKSAPFRMMESLFNAATPASPKTRGRSREERASVNISQTYSIGESRIFVITDSVDGVMPAAVNVRPNPNVGFVSTELSDPLADEQRNPGIIYIDNSSIDTTLDESIEDESRELDRLLTIQNQSDAELDDETHCIYSIDYAQSTQTNGLDGVDDLTNFIVKSINANNYQSVTIMNGTSRQSYMLDQHFCEQREDFEEDIYLYYLGISCFVALPEIFNVINAKTAQKCIFDNYLLIDSFLKLNPGAAYADARERINDLNFTARSLEAKCPDDQSKLLLLYAQIHKAASAAPQKKICFNYFTKSMSEASSLDSFFKENKKLIPFNVTIIFYFYMAGLVQEYSSVQGSTSGLIDFDYEENLHVLLDSNVDSDAEIEFPEEEIVKSQRYNDIYQLALNFNANYFQHHKHYTLSSKVKLNQTLKPAADEKPVTNNTEEKPDTREQITSPLRFFRSFTPAMRSATGLHNLSSPEGLKDYSPSC